MKSFYCYTHLDIAPHRVEAASKSDALRIALSLPTPRVRVIGAEAVGSDGPEIFFRDAVALSKPFACVARR